MAFRVEPINGAQDFATRTVALSRHPNHLRTELLAGAFEDNISTIEDRLHPRLRLRFQFLRRGWPVLASASVALAMIAAFRSATASTVVVSPPQPGLPVGRMATAPSVPSTTGEPTKVLEGVLPASVLALGVRRVIIDAGHGGTNPGTQSAEGIFEKQITLDIAERLRWLVVQRGLEAIMTRTADSTLSLQQRAELANGQRGDIFVSIHLNSFQAPTTRGIETYYLGLSDGPEPDALAAAENQHSGYSLTDMRHLLDRIYADARRDESHRLADAVQQSLMHTLRKTEPALTDRGVKTAPFVVLVATEMPAILAEVSCLSNASEATRLNTPEYRQTIAEALEAGIQTFINQAHGNESERTQTSGS